MRHVTSSSRPLRSTFVFQQHGVGDSQRTRESIYDLALGRTLQKFIDMMRTPQRVFVTSLSVLSVCVQVGTLRTHNSANGSTCFLERSRAECLCFAYVCAQGQLTECLNTGCHTCFPSAYRTSRPTSLRCTRWRTVPKLKTKPLLAGLFAD